MMYVEALQGIFNVFFLFFFYVFGPAAFMPKF